MGRWAASLMLVVAPLLGAQAQDFNGFIRWDFKIDVPQEMEMAKAYMPTYMEVYSANGKSRMKSDMMMGGDILTLDKKTYILMPSVKKAMMTDASKEEEKAGKQEAPKVKETAETATILGYKCKKYIVTIRNEQTGEFNDASVWTTEDVKASVPKGNSFLGAAKNIKGFPLKMQMAPMEGMTMTLTATKLELKKISDDMFKIPDGYTVEAFDPSKMGGMGGMR